jgi:hypothetical protein
MPVFSLSLSNGAASAALSGNRSFLGRFFVVVGEPLFHLTEELVLEQVVGTGLQFTLMSAPPFHAHKDPSC